MANIYNYSFSGSVPLSYSNRNFAQSTTLSGTFSVDFDNIPNRSGSFITSNIFADGIKLDTSLIGINNYPDGTSGYTVTAYRPATVSDTTVRNLTLSFSQPQSSSFSYVKYQVDTVDYSIAPAVSYSGAYESRNLALIAAPVCFTTGTLIRTSRGEVAVEDLQVGDLAVTASGTLRPITWLGHREMTAAGAALPFHQQPVRVRAGAFGQGLPARDLSLSPGHPVLVGADAGNEDGVLVPVMCLINGTTITREPRAGVTYWHVELDAHDILLAEGLPAESYIDGGDRAFFVEGSDHALHNPDFVAAGWGARCRPVAVNGPLVGAERLRLDAVFAGSLIAQCEWDAVSFV